MLTKEFVTLKLDEITPYENNPRINDDAVDDVIASIQQCENLDPIEIDENNVILSGHTRLKALKRLGYTETECLRYTGLTDKQKRKYRILANKASEKSLWDLNLLPLELEGLDFEGYDFDFDLPDLDNTDNTEVIEDEPPEVTDDFAKTGDLWLLGEHRLFCGDCTSAENIKTLMDGNKADMVFTDPPYNVAIGSKNKAINDNRVERGLKRTKSIEDDIANDKGMTDEEIGENLWKPAFINMREFSKDCCNIYVTMPQGGTHMMMMMMMMMKAGWQVKHEIMWEKNSPTFSMGRLDYDYQHEPICYGWNKSHVFYGKGEQNKSVWKYDKPRKCDLHPTMKPIALVANALLNSSKSGDVILDAFGGSGSTLIACEQLKRKCFMTELSEHYVSVIVDRYINTVGGSDNVFCIRNGEKIAYSDIK